MKKLLLLLMFSIVLVGVVSAGISQLPEPITFGECIELPQTCSDCTYNNISNVIFPNSTQGLGQVQMTKSGTNYNYTFCNTQTFGTFTVNGYGDPAGALTTWSYTFIVGEDLTTGRAISYIGFIIILFFIFLLTIMGAVKIRWKHLRSDEDKIISVNNFRYFKVTLFALAYFEMMFLFGLSYKFFNEANIEGFTSFFNFVYQLFLNLMYPLIVFLIIIFFIIWVNNIKLKKKLKLGL